ncbi:hypothetical protein HDU76_003406, partial [Blyttiomyces sp. JEL0837]
MLSGSDPLFQTNNSGVLLPEIQDSVVQDTFADFDDDIQEPDFVTETIQTNTMEEEEESTEMDAKMGFDSNEVIQDSSKEMDFDEEDVEEESPDADADAEEEEEEEEEAEMLSSASGDEVDQIDPSSIVSTHIGAKRPAGGILGNAASLDDDDDDRTTMAQQTVPGDVSMDEVGGAEGEGDGEGDEELEDPSEAGEGANANAAELSKTNQRHLFKSAVEWLSNESRTKVDESNAYNFIEKQISYHRELSQAFLNVILELVKKGDRFNTKVLELLGKAFSKYVSETNRKDNAVLKFCGNPWNPAIAVPLASNLSEISLSTNARKRLIEKIISHMKHDEPNLSHMIRLLMLLSKKSSKTEILQEICEYFRERDRQTGNGPAGEFAKVESSKGVVLSRFLLSLLFALCQVQRFESPIVDLLRTITTDSFKDFEKRDRLRWLAKEMPEGLPFRIVDVKTLIALVVQKSEQWDGSMIGLLQFAIALLEGAASGEEKIDSHLQDILTLPALGAWIILQLITKHVDVQINILDQLLSRIASNSNNNVAIAYILR